MQACHCQVPCKLPVPVPPSLSHASSSSIPLLTVQAWHMPSYSASQLCEVSLRKGSHKQLPVRGRVPVSMPWAPYTATAPA